MKLPTSLTFHARERLIERTSLSEPELLSLFDNFQTVSVGYRQVSGHWHRLFFSEKDRAHFVAIQDIRSGDVITILPLDYHTTLAWGIEEKQKRKAVWKSASHCHSEMYPQIPTPRSTTGVKMQMTGVFTTKGKLVNLGSYRFSSVPTCAADALNDDAFVSKLFIKIEHRNADLALLVEILLYDRATDLFLKLNWQAIADFSTANEVQLKGPETRLISQLNEGVGCSGGRVDA